MDANKICWARDCERFWYLFKINPVEVCTEAKQVYLEMTLIDSNFVAIECLAGGQCNGNCVLILCCSTCEQSDDVSTNDNLPTNTFHQQLDPAV